MGKCKHEAGDKVAVFLGGHFAGCAQLQERCGDHWSAVLFPESGGMAIVTTQGLEMVAGFDVTQPLKDEIGALKWALEHVKQERAASEARAEVLARQVMERDLEIKALLGDEALGVLRQEMCDVQAAISGRADLTMVYAEHYKMLFHLGGSAARARHFFVRRDSDVGGVVRWVIRSGFNISKGGQKRYIDWKNSGTERWADDGALLACLLDEIATRAAEPQPPKSVRRAAKREAEIEETPNPFAPDFFERRYAKLSGSDKKTAMPNYLDEYFK
jgi:hypothetical protein